MSETLQPQTASVGTNDWVNLLPDTDHVRFFKSCDWAATRLGPNDKWSLELRLYTLQAFADIRPVCIYWGVHRVAIYNAAFVLLAGKTHPGLMGSRFDDVYPEIVSAIGPLFTQAEVTRMASPVIDLPLIVERNDFREETFFNGNFVPIMLLDGGVGGFANNVQEVTKQILGERRTQMFNLMSASKDQFTSTSVYGHITSCLNTNRLDVPFACLWKVDTENDDGNHELIQLDGLGLPATTEVNQRTKLLDNIGFMPLLAAARKKITTIGFDKNLGDLDWEHVI